MAKGKDYPRQDRKAGLARTQLGDRRPTKYDPQMALQIIEHVAQGKLIKDICKPGTGFCSITTFYAWVARVPELKQAYQAARELSALVFEEEAIDSARELQKSPGDNQNIRANEVVISQLRWSAQRRDPRNYGEKGQTLAIVPVHIETTLNLGDGGKAGSGAEIPDIYTLDPSAITDVTPIEEKPSPTMGLTVADMGSEATAIGHRPVGGGPNRKKIKLTPRIPPQEDIQSKPEKE